MRAAKEGLASSNEFSKVALPTLTKLIPQAQASTPGLQGDREAVRPDDRADPRRRSARSRAKSARLLSQANKGSEPLEKTVRSFGNSLGGLNSFFNELAYKPKGDAQSYLFYLPWANHDLNSAFSLQDAERAGPAQPARDQLHRRRPRLRLAATRNGSKDKPYLETLLKLGQRPAQAKKSRSRSRPNPGTCENRKEE